MRDGKSIGRILGGGYERIIIYQLLQVIAKRRLISTDVITASTCHLIEIRKEKYHE
jgi:hypothetical protein